MLSLHNFQSAKADPRPAFCHFRTASHRLENGSPNRALDFQANAAPQPHYPIHKLLSCGFLRYA